MRTKQILALCSLCSLLVFSLFMLQSGARADDQDKKASDKKAATQDKTVAKPMTEKQRKANEAKLKKELETPYKKWLNEEVIYIISQAERDAFNRLQTDEERVMFILQFWLRRDPTPNTDENQMRDEHYRRIAYANENFTTNDVPGWRTDRGMIYIKYGPPDEREQHLNGGTYQRPPEEGGGTTTTFPFEKWRYRYIEGMGTNVDIEFVDTQRNGMYHMTLDPHQKDALLQVPVELRARFSRTDGSMVTPGQVPATESQFQRLERYTQLQAPPAK
jgi:GWxTD domain-containing protein